MPPRMQPRSTRAGARGFTLIELLVVIGIMALIVSMVSISVTNDPAQILRRDAQRLALSLQAATQDVAATGSPLRLVANARGWHFERRMRASDDPAELTRTRWTEVNPADGGALAPYALQAEESRLIVPGGALLLSGEPYAQRIEARLESPAARITVVQEGTRVPARIESIQ
jgi:type II secretion system protein H